MKSNILQGKPDKEYFLILLPIYFVFHGFTENYTSVFLSEILVLALQYLLVTITFFFIFFFIYKSWRRAALFVFTLMLFYLFFGPFHDTLKKNFPDAFFVKYIFILPSAIIFFVCLFFIFKRTKRNFTRLVRFLNLFLIICILIDLPFLLKHIINSNRPASLSKEFERCDSCSKPDIYLIVADEYAGRQELYDIFHFDNSRFENFLVSEGFHIVKNSKSNYNYTSFSAASMLSMNFLNGIEGRNSNRKDINICYGLINKNNLWNFFEANGYEIKNYSVFNINDIPTEIPNKMIFIGNKLITSQTFLSRLDRDIRFNLVTRFKINSEIKRIANYVKECNEKSYGNLMKESLRVSKKPKFIYTHLMMPHYPYYYDSSGRELPLEMLTEGNQIRKTEYLSYLKYCNKKFSQMLHAILANSKKPPIIIFMGDHGWRHFTEQAVDHQYHFMNLASIYLPDKNYSPFYDGMSNINMFRILLNSQFHQKISLLRDSTSFVVE
jgi:hypothetical protein